MATYTPNLNLKKPSTGEYYDVVADHNDAKDKIDIFAGRVENALLNSVINYGAKGDGVTDDTVAIQAACNYGGQVYFPTGDYLVSGLVLTQNLVLELNGSTLKRFGNLKPRMIVSYGELKVRNGTIDGNNQGVSYGHALEFNSENSDLRVENMTFKNNCLGGFESPTASQDTDLLNIVKAKNVIVKDSVFDLASRNGIAITGAVKTVKVHNNHFNHCYLFGFDIEPNTPIYNMYESVIVSHNTFTNNGSRGADQEVWNHGNGGIHIGAPVMPAWSVTRFLNVSNNIMTETELTAFSEDYIEPGNFIGQYEYLNFNNNTIINMQRLNINYGTTNNPAKITNINNNTMTNSAGSTLEVTLNIWSKGTIFLTGNMWNNAFGKTGLTGILKESNNSSALVLQA